MTWLRIDDGFTQHPKLAGWRPPQKWAWLEVLTYCARYETGGLIPDDLGLLPRSVTETLLKKAENSGLIERTDDLKRVVHDWPIYNGKNVAEKVAYCLAKHPEATANDVYKAIGGKRELVLAEVAKQREGGSLPGTQGGSREPLQGGSLSGSQTGTKPYPALDPVDGESSESVSDLLPSSNESPLPEGDIDFSENGRPQDADRVRHVLEEGGISL